MRCAALALALLAGLSWATTPEAGQTLPEWGRALSPAEARDLRDTVARAAQQNRLAYATLSAITRAVGRSDAKLSFPQLIAQVEGKAREAAALATQLAALKRRVSILESDAARDPAAAALARADAAFREGRLEDADHALAELEALRRSDAADARQAWVAAIRSRAEIARLRLDYVKAAALQRAAGAELAAVTRQLAAEQWRLLRDAARDDIEQAKLSGDRAVADRAITALTDEVLPLAPRATQPEQWGRTQHTLGIALTVQGEREEGTAALDRAVAAFTAAAGVCAPDRFPELWAQVQTGLADAEIAIGARQTGVVALRRAADAAAAAITVLSPAEQPDLWADAQSDRAIALQRIYERDGDLASLRQAAEALRAALAARSRERSALLWAKTENNLGATLLALGNAEPGVARYEEAAAAHRAALSVYHRDSLPLQWAGAQNNLAVAYYSLADREAAPAARAQRLEAAIAAFGEALDGYKLETVPLDWAMTTGNLGSAMQALGEARHDAVLLERAAAAIRATLAVYKRDTVPTDWAMTQLNLGSALTSLGIERGDPATLDEAAAASRAALQVYKREEGPTYWAMTQVNLGRALLAKAKLVPGCAVVREADAALAAATPLYERPDLAGERAAVARSHAEAAAAVRAQCR